MAERAIKTHNCYTGKRGMDVQDSDSRLFQPSSGRFTNMLCFLDLVSGKKKKRRRRKTATTTSTRISSTQRIIATPKLSSKLKIIIKRSERNGAAWFVERKVSKVIIDSREPRITTKMQTYSFFFCIHASCVSIV